MQAAFKCSKMTNQVSRHSLAIVLGHGNFYASGYLCDLVCCPTKITTGLPSSKSSILTSSFHCRCRLNLPPDTSATSKRCWMMSRLAVASASRSLVLMEEATDADFGGLQGATPNVTLNMLLRTHIRPLYVLILREPHFKGIWM